MWQRRSSILWLITVLCTVAAAFIYDLHLTVLTQAENHLRDRIAQFGRFDRADPRLVFLAIDQDSISLDAELDIKGVLAVPEGDAENLAALGLMSRGWQWPREVYARILERLVNAGARVVLFDLTFPTPAANHEDDARFRLALDKYKDRVVIGSNFVSATSPHGTVAPIHAVPTASLIPDTKPLDDRVAYVNFWPESDDGVVRNAQYRVTFEQVNGGIDPDADSEKYMSLASRAAMKGGFGDFVPHDLDPRILRFAGPAGTFSPHSVFELFVPKYWTMNYEGGRFFRDKIVIVGAYGNWQHDEHQTPFGLMPGPELQLNALNALLHRSFIREVSNICNLAIILFTGVCSLALWRFMRDARWRFLALVVANGCWLLVALLLFNYSNTYVVTLMPLIVLNFNGLIGLCYDVTVERLEKSRVRQTLEKYVSKNVVRELLDKPDDFNNSLGGVVKPATILFSDIRNFTTVSARTTPHALVAQLNEYLTAMVECVFAHNGTLDKFIGDAVMAVWGNGHSEGPRGDAINAVRSALAMRKALQKLNLKWRSEGRTELQIGMALNHGDVVVGNIGSPSRMEFTVIGDAVNITWRLQELTKQHGTDLLIGESVELMIQSDFALEYVDRFRGQGMDASIDVYSIGEHRCDESISRIDLVGAPIPLAVR